jgi:predicted RNA-binding Zn-ribbon protein involved in translation (DUF1610 family)
MDFDELEKYRTGKSEDGNDQFSVPIRPDADGLLGRECSNAECETKYFKISTEVDDAYGKNVENFSQLDLTCPYCGQADNMQHLHTTDQVEWIKSMMIRGIHKSFQNIMSRSFPSRSKPRGGMFSVSMEFKRGSLPSVRHYAEERLKQEVVCDHCKFRYAIYGVSFHCPLCGKGNILQHLERSSETIRILVNESERIGTEHGPHVAEAILGNALEDVVGLFEGFLKYAYRYAIRKAKNKDDADKLIQKIRTNFQRLSGAEEIFRRDLSIECFQRLDAKELDALDLTFAKRHVLTHNLGLVDDKFKSKAKTWERVSSELLIEPGEVTGALNSTNKVLAHVLNEILNE